MFRQIDTRTRPGQAFFYCSGRGELASDEISIELWQESIHKNVEAFRFKPDLDGLDHYGPGMV